MTLAALDLVREVEQAGGQLQASGGRLKVRAPKPLPDELVAALRARKPEIIDCLAVGSPMAPAARPDDDAPTVPPDGKGGCLPQWDAETGRLIAWLKTTSPLAQPFELQPGVWMARPVRYWSYRTANIAAGPGGPRAHYGALQGDLRKLHALFGSKPEHPNRPPMTT